MAQLQDPLPGGTLERTDQGVDISASPGDPIVAVENSKLIGVIQNWYNGQPFEWFRILTGPFRGKYWYVAEQIDPVTEKTGTIFRRGQVVAHYAQTGTAIETGFATRSGQTLARATTGYTEGEATPAGSAFRRAIGAGPPGTKVSGRVSRSPVSTQVTLEKLWIDAGGPPNVAQTMAAIAIAESGGKPDTRGGPNTNGTYDYGLWQINTVNVDSHHWSIDQLLHNPLYNAKAAVAIYKSSGLQAWSSYNSGVYRKFLGQDPKVTLNFGGVGGSRPRPGSQNTGPDIETVLHAYESQYDTPGQGVGPDFVGLFGTPIPTPGDVWGAITGAITAPLDAAKFLVWLFNPVHILRMVELVIGLILMGYGLRSLVPRSSGLASSGSGIARVTQAVASATPVGREVRMAQGRVAGRREGQVEHARLQARRASRQKEAARSS